MNEKLPKHELYNVYNDVNLDKGMSELTGVFVRLGNLIEDINNAPTSTNKDDLLKIANRLQGIRKMVIGANYHIDIFATLHDFDKFED